MDPKAAFVSLDPIRNPVESDDKHGLSWKISNDIKGQLNVGNDGSVQRFLKRTLQYFHRVDRPTYMGHIAVELGISLRQLELLITILCDANEIYKLSFDELKVQGLDTNGEVYALTSRSKSWMAHD